MHFTGMRREKKNLRFYDIIGTSAQITGGTVLGSKNVKGQGQGHQKRKCENVKCIGADEPLQ